MGFFNFFKPKWQHRDKAVRLKAVRDLSKQDREILESIARSDDDLEVRLAAVAKIEDVDLLAALGAAPGDDTFKRAVLDRRNTRLAEVVLTAQEDVVRNEAFGRIDDVQTLAGIALDAEATGVRLQAVGLIADESVLAGILEKPCGKEVSLAALARINDPDIVKRLVDSASNRAARRLAAERLGTLTQPVNSQGEKIKELEALANEAKRLAESRQWEKAAARFIEIESAWRQHDPEGVHPQKNTVDSALRQFAERRKKAEAKRADELRRAEEYSQEAAKREALCQMVEALVGSREPDAEARFEHARSAWPESGHFAALNNRFNEACERYKAAREAINAEKKLFSGYSEEVSRCERLISGDDWRRAAPQLDDLVTRLGNVKFKYLDKLELKDRLASARKRFNDRLEVSRAEEARQVDNATARRQELCEDLEKLVNHENRQEAEKQVRKIETSWTALKPLADAEKTASFEGRFAEIMGRFKARQNEFYHRQDWQLWANCNLKDELCQQVEALDSQNDLAQVAERIKAAQAEWKKIGPLPRKEADILWQRFHEACERNFARCAPYFAEQDRLRNEVLIRKEEICLEAERLADSTDWKETAKQLKELQTEWKGLASVPRHKEEKLYKRFRQACNHFFSRSSAHFSEKDQELRRNLAEKNKLCEELEAISAAPQADQADRVRELQAAWKAIRAVPRDEAEAVWQRFKKGLDGYKDFLDGGRQENLLKKEALCVLVEEQIAAINESTDMQALAERFAAMKQEWRQVGPVPEVKNEEIWQRFSRPIDEFLALRREQLRQINAINHENQRRKEDVIAQAEKLAALEIWDEAAIEAMHGLERQWCELGPAPKDKEALLREDFKGICEAFFSGQRQFFVKRLDEQLINQRHKEIVCLKLENLLGLQSQESGQDRNKTLTLAEEMKLALELNFTYAGLRADGERLAEEIERLRAEWRKIGPAPPGQEHILDSRFSGSIDQYHERAK